MHLNTTWSWGRDENSYRLQIISRNSLALSLWTTFPDGVERLNVSMRMYEQICQNEHKEMVKYILYYFSDSLEIDDFRTFCFCKGLIA